MPVLILASVLSLSLLAVAVLATLLIVAPREERSTVPVAAPTTALAATVPPSPTSPPTPTLVPLPSPTVAPTPEPPPTPTTLAPPALLAPATPTSAAAYLACPAEIQRWIVDRQYLQDLEEQAARKFGYVTGAWVPPPFTSTWCPSICDRDWLSTAILYMERILAMPRFPVPRVEVPSNLCPVH